MLHVVVPALHTGSGVSLRQVAGRPVDHSHTGWKLMILASPREWVVDNGRHSDLVWSWPSVRPSSCVNDLRVDGIRPRTFAHPPPLISRCHYYDVAKQPRGAGYWEVVIMVWLMDNGRYICAHKTYPAKMGVGNPAYFAIVTRKSISCRRLLEAELSLCAQSVGARDRSKADD